MDWFFNFPSMERNDLREFKKTVDFTFTDFTRSYGADIEGFFEPLLMFLVWFEKFFINTPSVSYTHLTLPTKRIV